MTSFDRDEAEIEASRAPLMDHLIELRGRLLICVVAFAVAFIALSVSTLGVFTQPASGEPVAYTAVIAAEASNVETPATTNGSDEAASADALSAEQAELMAGDPDPATSLDVFRAMAKAGADVLDFNAAPLIRCDVAPWTLWGISLAGFNFLISSISGAAIVALAAYRN